MPVFGGAGYDPDLVAQLNIEVDTSGLDRGLNAARQRATSGLNEIGATAERTSRRFNSAFQNVSYQVQDFVVQIASGQSAVRALAQQVPQAVAALGLFGGPIGIIASLVATLAAAGLAMLSAGSDAKTAAQDVNDLNQVLKDLANSSSDTAAELNKLAEAFLNSSKEAQGLQLTAITGKLDELRTKFQDAKSDFEGTINDFGALVDSLGLRIFNSLGGDTLAALQDVTRKFKDGQIGADEFLGALKKLAPDETVLFQAAEQAVDAQKNVVEFGSALDAVQKKLDAIASARERQGQLKGEDIFPKGGESPPGPFAVHDQVKERPAAAPRQAAAPGQTEAERNLETLRQRLATVRAQIDILATPGGSTASAAKLLKDLTEAAAAVNLTPESLKNAPPALQEYVEALAAANTKLREMQEAELAAAKTQQEAAAKREEEVKKLVSTKPQFEGPTPEELKSREDAGRIETASRLPDEIDAANIAAQQLSATLTDIGNLSFDSLLGSLAAIGESIAQQIIQALIFRAIMAGINAATGGTAGLASVAVAAAGGAAGGRTNAAGGAVAAGQGTIVGERGPEYFEPSVPGRIYSNNELQDIGAGQQRDGKALTINVDARGATPGMEANIFNGVRRIVRREAPRATAESNYRGTTKDPSKRAPY